MKLSGAKLVVKALEQIGVRYTFGIPGVHTTELYDALNDSDLITPILVTHEAGAAFMADGLSRTSSGIGTLVIVPAAGATHAMSGIGEAFLDGSPMLIISGGTRRDSGRFYQLHQLDQQRLMDGLVKKFYVLKTHEEIVPAIYEAYQTARSGEPGPVFIEVPVELQLFQGEVSGIPEFKPAAAENTIDRDALVQAADLLMKAHSPGIYVGWGAVGATAESEQLSELLVAPVATTLQGLSAFSARHPNHTGVGFGPAAVPAAQKAFAACDCLLAVGLRFAELATGSYGLPVPKTLIHADINPEVFNKNYPATVTLTGDSKRVILALLEELARRDLKTSRSQEALSRLIAKEKKAYLKHWQQRSNDLAVSPGVFFKTLREAMDDDALVVADDGKHTFLTAELLPIYHPRHFISPTDFNCMGFCVPAAIGAKLANPDKQVIGIAGDGAFLMTGMELLTAATYKIGLVIFIFHDGELGQISQFQKIPLNRKTCTVLGQVNFEGMALASGTSYLAMRSDDEIASVIAEALTIARASRPVIVDVTVDYSQETMMTKGVVKVNLSRFPAREKVRFLVRALKRHVTG